MLVVSGLVTQTGELRVDLSALTGFHFCGSPYTKRDAWPVVRNGGEGCHGPYSNRGERTNWLPGLCRGRPAVCHEQGGYDSSGCLF